MDKKIKNEMDHDEDIIVVLSDSEDENPASISVTKNNDKPVTHKTDINKIDKSISQQEESQKDLATLKRDSEPFGKDLATLKRDSEPLGKDLVTLKRDSEPLGKDLAMLKRDSEPLDKDLATLKRDLEPLDKDPKYKNLVLSGGSIKGISQIGAVKKLIDENLIDLKKLKAVAGTSAGSLLGILIVLGFSIDEIWNFIYCLDLKNAVKPDFLMFLQKCGVETGQIIHNLIEDILTKKTGTKHINFRQLYEVTKIHFIVVGSCLTTKEIVYYDHINTPNFKVSMAIRISISIPGFFTPITIGKNKYIDGGVLNDYPMNLFADKLDETIGILVCSEYNTDYKYPEEYFMAIINLFLFHYYQKTIHQWFENTIYIKKQVNSVHVFNFNVDNETKKDLYNCGIEASEEFIKRKFNKKVMEGDF